MLCGNRYGCMNVFELFDIVFLIFNVLVYLMINIICGIYNCEEKFCFVFFVFIM